MDLADCYRLLGLRTGASYEEIKTSYRRLARRYHPDANPANQQQAQDKFIQLTEAYKALTKLIQPEVADASASERQSAHGPAHGSAYGSAYGSAQARTSSYSPRASSPPPKASPQVQVRITKKAPPIQTHNLSVADQKLKGESYHQLQQLLKQQRFPRAVALIEGLAQRLPNDAEVRQWQAITYQRFGRYLISTRQSEKARVYLKKALRTDPHNKSLWYEVERDFRRIEQIEIY
jgi:curved DNA-binding protein CbpA